MNHFMINPEYQYKDILCAVWKDESGTLYLTRSLKDKDPDAWFLKAHEYGFSELHYGLFAKIINWSDVYMNLNLTPTESKVFLDDKTALVIVDMVNGFLTEGVLSSPRSASVLPECEKLLTFFKDNNLPCIAFADCHEPDCIEFSSFPPHCIRGTSESEIAPELQKIGGYLKIEKNSTNGFLTPEFQKFLKENQQLERIVVCGVCTDICVMQFCLTLKTFCNQENRKLEVLLPVNAVETYDAPNHNADSMQKCALEIMAQAGIKLTSEVTYHE